MGRVVDRIARAGKWSGIGLCVFPLVPILIPLVFALSILGILLVVLLGGLAGCLYLRRFVLFGIGKLPFRESRRVKHLPGFDERFGGLVKQNLGDGRIVERYDDEVDAVVVSRNVEGEKEGAFDGKGGDEDEVSVVKMDLEEEIVDDSYTATTSGSENGILEERCGSDDDACEGIAVSAAGCWRKEDEGDREGEEFFRESEARGISTRAEYEGGEGDGDLGVCPETSETQNAENYYNAADDEFPSQTTAIHVEPKDSVLHSEGESRDYVESSGIEDQETGELIPGDRMEIKARNEESSDSQWCGSEPAEEKEILITGTSYNAADDEFPGPPMESARDNEKEEGSDTAIETVDESVIGLGDLPGDSTDGTSCVSFSGSPVEQSLDERKQVNFAAGEGEGTLDEDDEKDDIGTNACDHSEGESLRGDMSWEDCAQSCAIDPVVADPQTAASDSDYREPGSLSMHAQDSSDDLSSWQSEVASTRSDQKSDLQSADDEGLAARTPGSALESISFRTAEGVGHELGDENETRKLSTTSDSGLDVDENNASLSQVTLEESQLREELGAMKDILGDQFLSQGNLIDDIEQLSQFVGVQLPEMSVDESELEWAQTAVEFLKVVVGVA